jgi:hypothetical protein
VDALQRHVRARHQRRASHLRRSMYPCGLASRKYRV